jgi:hypothetical protein
VPPAPSGERMRRRDLLRSGAAGLALPVAGGAAAAARDPASYAPLGRVALDDAREVVVGDDGRYAYVAATTHVAVVDITDPVSPTIVAEVEVGADHEDGPLGGIQDVAVDGDRVVACGPPGPTSDRFWGFGLFDVADPTAPVETAFVKTTTHANHNADVAGDHVYLTGSNGGLGGEERLRIYDVAGDSPTEVATWAPMDHDAGWEQVNVNLRTLHDVTVQDGIAYCAYWDAGTFLVDVSDPASPELLTRFGDHSLAELREVRGADIREYLLQPPGNAHYVAPNADGSVVAVGGESWDIRQGDDRGGPSPVELYDLSDPQNPSKLSTIAPEATGDNTFRGWFSTAHNFEFAGDRLYTAWYNAGVKVHDVSDPANPELLAWYADPSAKSFWTAQSAVQGECFVATTYRHVPNADDSALYTFPDEAGQMASPPRFPALDDGTATTAAPTSATSTDAPPTTDGPPTTAAAPTTTDRTSEPPATGGADGTTSDASGSTSGFGPLAGLAGVGLAGWRLLDRTRDDD